ncbi:MAG: hypothetical protein C4581_04595 [Nitrospiraceae bacterium]|nr:MAG: hypothetical protein C4581_04595 [Nitrospiraceae bacterium]
MRVMRNLAVLFVISLSLFSPLTSACAGIVVYDEVVPVGKPVKLSALTKGRFMPEGGRLVRFHIDGKSLGTHLSGGDGYAFFKHTPLSAGLFKLKAESGRDMDEGTLLVTAKTDRVLLIEIELLYEKPPFSLKLLKDSQGVLQSLSKNFRIVYLATMTGAEVSRKAVTGNNLPLSPVFKWGGAELIEDLKVKGIRPYAILASPGVISEAADIGRRYSFEETETGVEVKDWNDLLKHLNPKK